MKYCYYTLLAICLLLSAHGANAQQDKDLQKYYSDQLMTNGVLISADVTALPYVDIKRIMDFNFDNYRSYDHKAQVKLINGPEIELLSIVDRLKGGATIDKDLVEKRKNITSITYKHASMPIVDVKIGYKAPVLKKERGIIYRLPKATR
jgi:hypothetical protein